MRERHVWRDKTTGELYLRYWRPWWGEEIVRYYTGEKVKSTQTLLKNLEIAWEF